MNAKYFLLPFIAAMNASTWAIDLPYILKDPLLASPPVLEAGTVFPGQVERIYCAQRFDFEPAYSAEKPFSLAIAVDMALCHNPQIKATWAGIKAQAAAKGEARAAYLPTVNLTASSLSNHTSYAGDIAPDVRNQGQTKYASLTWRLLDFGSRSANLESSQQLLNAAIASHDLSLQKVLNAVISAYFNAMTSQATYQARQQAVDFARNTSKTTKKRESNGVAAVSDTLQALSSLAKSQLALNRAEGEMNKAMSVLIYAIGLPSETPLVLPIELDKAKSKPVADLKQWLIDAQASHPSIAAARAQFSSARAKLDAVRSDGLPYLDFNQNYYRNGYPNQGLSATQSTVNTIGFTLTVPLFEGFARTYKVRGAQAQLEQSYAQFLDTELQVSIEVIKAHADAVSSFENLEASAAWLDAAQSAVLSSQKRYDKGVADILELLTTQNTLADAQQERVRCIAEWRAAQLRLMANAGMLDRYQLAAPNLF